MLYVFRGVDSSKAKRSGRIEAPDKAAAAEKLRQDGITIISLDEEKRDKQAEDILERFRKVKTEDLVLATRQLAMMIDAGITVGESLRILVEQTDSARLGKVFGDVADVVESGQALSEGLSRHPSVFDRLYIGMVKAGEDSGELDQTLSELSNRMEANMRLKKTLKSAMVYPVTVAAVSLILSLGIIVFIVPQFESMFNQFEGDLPAPTAALVSASHVIVPPDGGLIPVKPILAAMVLLMGIMSALVVHGVRRMPASISAAVLFGIVAVGWGALYMFGGNLPGSFGQSNVLVATAVRVAGIVLGIFAVMMGFRAWSRTPGGRYTFDVMKLHIPMKIGKLIRKIVIARWTGTLSTLIKAGMPMIQSMEVVSDASSNYVYERATLDIRDGVIRGDKLARLIDDTEVFPPMVIQMVNVGERTGRIEDMLHKVAEYYDFEIEATLKSLASLVEPVLMLVIGVIVGAVVICLFLPMFSLYQTIAQQAGLLIAAPLVAEMARRAWADRKNRSE